MLTSARNKKTIEDQLVQINNIDGTFSRNGMWKIKLRLFPKNYDHPMAKKDDAGSLITVVEPLKKLYHETLHKTLHNIYKLEKKEKIKYATFHFSFLFILGHLLSMSI